MSKYKLIRELHKTGAAKPEARALADLAEKIKPLSPPGMSKQAKEDLLKEIAVKPRYGHPLRWAVAGSFAGILMIVTVFAQSALPGSWLYGIKRTSEEVRTVVQPGYTENLIEERKSEVEQLKKQETVDEELIKEAEQRLEKTNEKYNSNSEDSKSRNWWQNWKPNRRNNQRDNRTNYQNDRVRPARN